MKFLEKIKRFLFGDLSPTTENFKAENNISRIDLSHIEINRDLSEEEMFLKRSFSQEIAQGDINSLIKYGEDMAKEINYYLEISRKIINQNLVLSSPSNKSLNINDAIKQKVRISFNMSEINSIIEDLQRIKRESEIRLLALEEAQDLELNAASRKVFFFCNKRDVTRLKSIQTAISRISTTVSVITSVLQSIKIEYYASLKENTALDNIIFQNDPEENIKLANTCLLNLFSELDKTRAKTVDDLRVDYCLWQDAFADIYKMWYSDKIINGTYIPTGSKFLQIYYALNKKVRMEQSKPEKERLWNVREVYLQDEDKGPYIKIGSRKTYKIKLKVNLWSLIFKFKKLIPGYEGEVYNSDDLINKLTDIDSFRIDDDIPSHIYYTNEGKTFISLNGKNTFKPGRLDYTEFMDKMLSVYIIQLLSLQKYNFVYNGIYVGNPNKEEQIKNNPSSDDILKQTLISGIIDFLNMNVNLSILELFQKILMKI